MDTTNSNGLTGANSQPAKTYTENTNDLDSATGTSHSKAIATLIAVMAIRGHAVHTLADGGFIVCKYGMSHYAPDVNALRAFAVRLGVSHE